GLAGDGRHGAPGRGWEWRRRIERLGYTREARRRRTHDRRREARERLGGGSWSIPCTLRRAKSTTEQQCLRCGCSKRGGPAAVRCYSRALLASSARGFALERSMSSEELPAREAMEFDVVIVGAGPAGLAAAIRPRQL